MRIPSNTAAFVALAVLVACRGDDSALTSPTGPQLGLVSAASAGVPLTIKTVIDFSQFPFSGTFDVTVGAADLGCEGGTFVDFPARLGGKGFIAKVFTCNGPATGTFTANFQPLPVPGPGDANGHWNIVESTDDFANLRGEGDFSVTFVPPSSGEETLTGSIHFHP